MTTSFLGWMDILPMRNQANVRPNSGRVILSNCCYLSLVFPQQKSNDQKFGPKCLKDTSKLQLLCSSTYFTKLQNLIVVQNVLKPKANLKPMHQIYVRKTFSVNHMNKEFQSINYMHCILCSVCMLFCVLVLPNIVQLHDYFFIPFCSSQV